MKWAIELSEFNINYKPRAAIKAQVMADFVAKFTEPKVDSSQADIATNNNNGQVWQVIVDGSLGEHGARAGIVLESLGGEEISYVVRLEKFHISEKFQP